LENTKGVAKISKEEWDGLSINLGNERKQNCRAAFTIMFINFINNN